jgi:phenylacetate-coenzyme A ligase PaaK-like adenylate-forming protein
VIAKSRQVRTTMAGVVPAHAWDPVRAAVDSWMGLSRMSEIWWTRSAGRAAIDTARRVRLDALVEFARARSPYYRDAWRLLPVRRLRLAELPVVTKAALMARFDDWVTEPEIRLAAVESFLADRGQIGERFLDRFVVWKSSGSSGVPGIFVQDEGALATFDALMAQSPDPTQLAARYGWPVVAHGGRAALVTAIGDHFAGIASWRRLRRGSPWIAARAFSILDPLPRLVAALNDYQPAFLASYPTMLALLAEERRAGRLGIDPAAIWSGGECLPPGARADIEDAFGCRVADEYGASECMSIACGCREGWLHVNADWVVLEPVDDDCRPTPPGKPSRTVLLTNLANRVQPIIRYDLGDSVVVKPGPCECGSPLPAIQVEGRHDDVVSMTAPDGHVVRLLPLALTTIVEEAARVHRFQIVQTAADRLMLRLDRGDERARQGAWRAAAGALRRYLVRQSLPNVRVGLDERGPVADRRSGKLKEVVVARTTTGVHSHGSRGTGAR